MNQKILSVVTLALLFVVMLTATASILANLGMFGFNPDSEFAKKTLYLVLIEITAAIIFVLKTGALKESTICTTFSFQDIENAATVNLDIESCCYEIRNMRSEIIDEGKFSLGIGLGGWWEGKIPSPNNLDCSVVLRLAEKDGSNWEVRPFYPLSRKVEAIKL